MKNKKKIIVLIVVLLMLTGCGTSRYITDSKHKAIVYEKTGLMLQRNIICLPEKNGELYKVYKKHQKQLQVPFNELPDCNKFKINSNESNGLWELLFVKPLAYGILKLGKLVGNLGISLILIGLLIRIILLPFSIKSLKQSQNMRKAQPELEKIERKYHNRTDRESLAAKSQETMMLYKKYKVSPLSGCLLAFIQLPVFFAFLQAIYRTPAIYEQTLFGLGLGTTPLVGLKMGNYWYLLLLVLIAVSTYFSFKQSMKQTANMASNQASQMNLMLYIMLFMIVYASLNLPTAIAFYWIVTYAFISIQNIIVNYSNNDSLKNKNKKDKSKKENIKDKVKKKEGMKYGNNK